MKIRALIKHFGLAVVALSVAVACSSTPMVEEAPAPVPVVEKKKGISSHAEEAIARAKAARYRVNGLGCEWTDTVGLIEEAESQGESGRNITAIGLARKAEKRAARALKSVKNKKRKKWRWWRLLSLLRLRKW